MFSFYRKIISGTSVWCAPEAVIDDNAKSISSKADIFSFGLVLYECIACIPPHTYMADADDDNDKADDDSDEADDNNDESKESNEDESFDSENADLPYFESLMGTRPPLPYVETLSNDYDTLIEIFYVCTNESPEDRPTAKCLASALKKT